MYEMTSREGVCLSVPPHTAVFEKVFLLNGFGAAFAIPYWIRNSFNSKVGRNYLHIRMNQSAWFSVSVRNGSSKNRLKMMLCKKSHLCTHMTVMLLGTGERNFRFLFLFSKFQKRISNFSFSSRLDFLASRQCLLWSLLSMFTNIKSQDVLQCLSDELMKK